MIAFDVRILSSSLIGGMDIERFNREVRERHPARFEAAIDRRALDGLFGLARLESLFQSESIPLALVDVYDDGRLTRLVDVQRKSGKSAVAVAADNFRRGATIRLRDADRFDERLDRFAAQVARDFEARSQINVYLTPPARHGFPPHFDITDVFIVQCAGTKKWTIFHDYSNRTELPLAETNWDPERFRPSGPGEEMTLGAGDVLYLPRGVMHEASCQEDESMHLTVSIVPVTFADLVRKALDAAAGADVGLRRRVPWPADDAHVHLERLGNDVRERIIKLAREMDADALLRGERSSIHRAPETASRSGLQSAIAALGRSLRE
jgi:ribosomal protein L16 Arg81 hydroxylase